MLESEDIICIKNWASQDSSQVSSPTRCARIHRRLPSQTSRDSSYLCMSPILSSINRPSSMKTEENKKARWKYLHQWSHKALPGLEPGFWEFSIRIPSDNHYTIAPLLYGEASLTSDHRGRPLLIFLKALSSSPTLILSSMTLVLKFVLALYLTKRIFRSLPR